MNKTNQFSAKTQYITPSCKSAVLRSRETILTGSGDYDGRSGLHSIDDVQDGGENDHSTNWGW